MATSRDGLSSSVRSSVVWPHHVDLRCLHGDQGDWSHRTVIVPAVFREWHGGPPPSFLQAQYPVFLYQRLNMSMPCACPNKGYESGVYLQFIAQHYALLPLRVAFIQADWIFSTKTIKGPPFEFWQPRCSEEAAGLAKLPGSPDQSARLPWSDYMPLGGRRSVWPPRCVIRRTTFYARFPVLGRRNAWLMEACVRELFRLVKQPVRSFDRGRPLNITFYTNMNFLVSRERLHRHPHAIWRRLANRFVHEGVCVSEESPLHNMSTDSADGPGGVVDTRAFGKWTLGMTTEVLQQIIFGVAPVEDGPAPDVPLSAKQCTARASTKCTINT